MKCKPYGGNECLDAMQDYTVMMNNWATVLHVQHQQETKEKTPSRVTVKDNVVAW